MHCLLPKGFGLAENLNFCRIRFKPKNAPILVIAMTTVFDDEWAATDNNVDRMMEADALVMQREISDDSDSLVGTVDNPSLHVERINPQSHCEDSGEKVETAADLIADSTLALRLDRCENDLQKVLTLLNTHSEELAQSKSHISNLERELGQTQKKLNETTMNYEQKILELQRKLNRNSLESGSVSVVTVVTSPIEGSISTHMAPGERKDLGAIPMEIVKMSSRGGKSRVVIEEGTGTTVIGRPSSAGGPVREFGASSRLTAPTAASTAKTSSKVPPSSTVPSRGVKTGEATKTNWNTSPGRAKVEDEELVLAMETNDTTVSVPAVDVVPIVTTATARPLSSSKERPASASRAQSSSHKASQQTSLPPEKEFAQILEKMNDVTGCPWSQRCDCVKRCAVLFKSDDWGTPKIGQLLQLVKPLTLQVADQRRSGSPSHIFLFNGNHRYPSSSMVKEVCTTITEIVRAVGVDSESFVLALTPMLLKLVYATVRVLARLRLV